MSQYIVILHNFKDDPDGADDKAIGPFPDPEQADEFGRCVVEPYVDFLTYTVSELNTPTPPAGPDPLGLFG